MYQLAKKRAPEECDELVFPDQSESTQSDMEKRSNRQAHRWEAKLLDSKQNPVEKDLVQPPQDAVLEEESANCSSSSSHRAILDVPGGGATILPGQRLRQMRERAGVRVELIAEKLNLPKSHIEAIERDDYGKLPGTLYARGYIKNYCRLLNIDSSEIVALFNTLVAKPEPVQYSKPVQAERGGFSQRWRKVNLQWHLYAIISVFTLLMIVSFWPAGDDSSAEVIDVELEATQLYVDQLPDEVQVSVEQSVLDRLPSPSGDKPAKEPVFMVETVEASMAPRKNQVGNTL